MSIKTLIIFVTVYKEKSVTSAARKLNISQPAVSAALRELEQHYSIQLFKRHGRGIQKTKEARHLYEFASHITSLYQEMELDFKFQDRTLPLRIGSGIPIASTLLPDLIASFLRHSGGSKPYISIDHSHQIEIMVLENDLDLALIEGSTHSEKILSEPFAKEQLILICTPCHPLTHKKQITLEDLKEEQFLLPDKGSKIRELIESTFRLHELPLRPFFESSSLTAIIHGVLANLGISFLPKSMLTKYLNHGDLCELPLREKLELSYHLIYHQNKYLTPQMLNFMEFVSSQNYILTTD
ncbi:LysR family transcriptional regulator [Clostridium sp. E02]|uniref:LysR family transcriptional regulator n=1 Tax=Clostridium sp. E02 TaxID=2487134 RepID=UPI0013DE3125|nr:LysR family transcriptional regulator [Clostridium sp. E02]